MRERKVIITGLMAMTMVVGVIALFVHAAESQDGKAVKSEKVDIGGRLSCTFCALAHPEMQCKPECCTDCIKAGDPPLLTGKDMTTYLLLTGEAKTKLMNEERMTLVGQDVQVKGLLVKRKGIQAIYVDKIEKAGTGLARGD